jgi:hypothetical protein
VTVERYIGHARLYGPEGVLETFLEEERPVLDDEIGLLTALHRLEDSPRWREHRWRVDCGRDYRRSLADRMLRSDASLAQVSRTVGVHEATVRAWRRDLAAA